jgi:phosphoglycolate phosphatase
MDRAREAVVFDLDGTLLDTLADLGNSMNAVLAGAGFPEHRLEAYRYFVGEGMEMLVRRALPAAVRDDEAAVARSLQAMRDEYGGRWAEATRPYDGIPALLTELTSRRVPLAVLSNKPDDFTRSTVETLLADWSFAQVRGMRPDTPAKPDPTGALAVAEALNVAPHDVLYVGDTATDMKTACAAGMFALGVTWGFRDREELEANGAAQVIDAPAEALEWVATENRR